MTWTITHIASQDPGKTTPRIADERDQPVAYVLQPEHAGLLVAAPELLEALTKLHEDVENYFGKGKIGPMYPKYLDAAMLLARSAINKATQ